MRASNIARVLNALIRTPPPNKANCVLLFCSGLPCFWAWENIRRLCFALLIFNLIPSKQNQGNMNVTESNWRHGGKVHSFKINKNGTLMNRMVMLIHSINSYWTRLLKFARVDKCCVHRVTKTKTVFVPSEGGGVSQIQVSKHKCCLYLHNMIQASMNLVKPVLMFSNQTVCVCVCKLTKNQQQQNLRKFALFAFTLVDNTLRYSIILFFCLFTLDLLCLSIKTILFFSPFGTDSIMNAHHAFGLCIQKTNKFTWEILQKLQLLKALSLATIRRCCFIFFAPRSRIKCLNNFFWAKFSLCFVCFQSIQQTWNVLRGKCMLRQIELNWASAEIVWLVREATIIECTKVFKFWLI